MVVGHVLERLNAATTAFDPSNEGEKTVVPTEVPSSEAVCENGADLIDAKVALSEPARPIPPWPHQASMNYADTHHSRARGSTDG